VAVVDAGPGIPIEDRARLVRPFERGDASRNRATGGVGLGLSIVQSFADLHGGEFRIAEAAGGGTVASLRLAGAL
jgi:signal transduction histidine kinase